MKEIEQEELFEENQKYQDNKIAIKDRKILVVSWYVVIAIGIIIGSFFCIKEYANLKRYSVAVEKYDEGNYAEAKDIFSKLLDYKESSTYFTDCQYQIATLAFKSGEYSKAVEVFTQLEEYKDSAEYLTECSYRIAILDLESGKYNEAIDVFSKLNDYKDSAEYLKKAVFERKYANFNVNIDTDPQYYEGAGLKTIEEVEEAMSAFLYGDWFNKETGEKITVSGEQIGARPYGVNYATATGGTVVVNFYYLDEPEKTYDIANLFEEFEYIDMRVSTLHITGKDTNEEYWFYSMTAEDYNALVEQNAQAFAQRQYYTDDEIIQNAFSVFKSKIGGNYSGAGKLYHSANYSDAKVVYYWESKTYICTFVGKYSTNIFDIYGTSTKTYFVSAEYRDTGSGLMMLSFDLS